MLPDFDRADRLGEFWSYPQSRTFSELLIDCEEDRTLRCSSGSCARPSANRGTSTIRIAGTGQARLAHLRCEERPFPHQPQPTTLIFTVMRSV
jgi:hypothetical protein